MLPLPEALGLALYAAVLVLLAGGVLLRPAVAVAAVFCLFGLKQWGLVAHPWVAAHPLVSNYSVAVLVIAGIVGRLARGRCLLCHATPVWYAVLALYAYALASLLWTPRPDLALANWQHDYPYVLTAVVLAPLLVDSRADLNVALRWLSMTGAGILLLLLLFGEWGSRGLVVRAAGLEDETNPLAIAGLAGVTACAAMFVRWPRWPVAGWLLRMAIVVTCFVAIIRAGSRGQLLAVPLAMLIMMPIAYRSGRLGGTLAAAAGLSVVVATIAFGLAEYVQWFDERWTTATARTDAADRFAMGMALLDAWSRSAGTMVFGLGNSASFDPRIVGFYPHNVPIEILGEEGLVGFAIYLVILGLGARSLWQGAVAARGDAEASGIVAAAGAAALFFFLISLKEGNAMGSVYIFLSISLLGALPRAVADTAAAEATLPLETAAHATRFPNLLRP